jgi:peptide deformylase
MSFLSNALFVLILCFGCFFTSCKTGNIVMTKEEIYLIECAAPDIPFKVLQVSNPLDYIILRKKCTDIEEKDNKQLKGLIERMKATLKSESGVGIAAPQVGITRNIFLFVRVDKPEEPIEVAINPRITNHPDSTICFEKDGCLSIQGISENSIRYPWIEVEYTNEEGKLINERLEGYSRDGNFVAVIFQHEYDHLQGVLFTDKLCE